MKHVVAFSGGKDSTYLLYEMLRRKMPIDEIRFNDCGLEYPATYEWIDEIERRLNVKVTRYKTDKNFYDLFYKLKTKGKKAGLIRGFPPSNSGCWIQSDMKLKQKKNAKDEMVYVAIAANEAHRKPDKPNIATPLIDWGITEAMIVERLNDIGLMPPYYAMGFRRGGCWLCPYQPRGSLYLLWKHYPKLWEELRRLDKLCPHGFKDGVDMAKLEKRFKTKPEKYAPRFCKKCGLPGVLIGKKHRQKQQDYCNKHYATKVSLLW
jgi:3'-phosphoadenosine 5'-phosphosulfate sulfotransferase (PAPS reductase)/FAD synthetase